MSFLNLRSGFATSTIRRTLLVSVATATVLGGTVPLTIQPATASYSTGKSNVQGSWKTKLHLARLERNRLAVQLDVTDKPRTSYANAVYQLYAYHNRQWVQVYTNRGARLIRNDGGRVVLASEVIDCEKVSRIAGFDITDTALKAVVSVRYDNRQGRDQRVVFEQQGRYRELLQSQSAQLVRWDRDQSVDNQRYIGADAIRNRQQRSGFRLALAQNTKRTRKVVARLSLKQRTRRGFKRERFLGDYRYRMSRWRQQSMRIDGVQAGDRVVVRLFDQKDRFMGYSEFEVQRRRSLVTLVIGNRRSRGVVRTIQGFDRNDDGRFDDRRVAYDYFTQVSRTRDWRSAKVRFLKDSRGMYVSDFAHGASSGPSYDCITPVSFKRGQYRLVERSFYAFERRLGRKMTAQPGRLVRVVDLYRTNQLRYDVAQLLRDDELAHKRQDRLVIRERKRSKKLKYKRPKHHRFGRKFKQCKCYDDREDRYERRAWGDDDDDDDDDRDDDD